ncbi:hypothetical protein ACFQU1_20170 [Chelatococcus sp. GCM10030263]|uniref:hypothetical protein n=1 Tax=Chelatococcus sp. GCM10030263 TaxID=3273387 RepID=UPI0036208804
MSKMMKFAGCVALILGTVYAVVMALDASSMDAQAQKADADTPAAPVKKPPRPKPAVAKKPPAKPKPPEAAEEQAAPAESPAPSSVEAAAQAQPKIPLYAQHALQAGAQTCAPIVNHLGNIAADTDYGVQSVWNREEPNQHMFWQLLGMHYKGRPGLDKASSILIAAPVTPQSCEGVLVQVIPSSRSCGAIEESLSKEGGKPVDILGGVHNLLSVRGERVMLLPSGRSCVIVSMTGAQSQPTSQ